MAFLAPTVSTMSATLGGNRVVARSPAAAAGTSRTSAITMARATKKVVPPPSKKGFKVSLPTDLFKPKSDVAEFKPTNGKVKSARGKRTPVASEKRAMNATAAQQFSFKIPGKFFQANNDVVKTVELGFTKGNELFVGRLAMLGFAASILGEVLTGKGALAQFDLETGLPLYDTEPLILGLVAFNLFAALGGVLGLTTGTFVPEERITGGERFDATRSLARPGEFFGVSGFGFTKENELFVGRVAQLGFAASLIGEAITGVGPLAQLGLETGLPLSETEPLLLFFIAVFATFAINEGTGKFEEE